MNTRPFWRQLDILNPEEIDYSIGLIGAGGIGSPTFLSLIKMGLPEIDIWDHDTIEEHNVPNQLYGFEDAGKMKVHALADNMEKFAYPHQKITSHQKKWTGEIKDIMINAVDSMDERIKIWDKVKEEPYDLYIDARMGAELMRIYMVKDDDKSRKFYESTLYTSKEADEAPCTNRAIIYNTFIIAGLISSQVKKFIKEEEVNKEILFDLKNMEFIKS